jgi:hypothetical protein
MRSGLVLLSFALCADPALGQPAPPSPPAAVPPEVQQALTDPATADRLAATAQALSKAFLDLPVGEVQAAIEGRRPTSADRHRTVRSETGLSDRDIRAQIAAARPLVQQSMRALNDALPRVMDSMEQARQSIERAIANMPDPNYPRR